MRISSLGRSASPLIRRRMEESNLESGHGPVTLWITPIEMVVVHKGAVEEHSAVGLERTGDNICGIGRTPSICSWARAAFRVRLDHKSAKVGNLTINLVHLDPPPFGDTGIERVEGLQSTDQDRKSTRLNSR